MIVPEIINLHRSWYPYLIVSQNGYNGRGMSKPLHKEKRVDGEIWMEYSLPVASSFRMVPLTYFLPGINEGKVPQGNTSSL
ncbi:MAG: hypothetical protein HPY53_00825 [Brevinematales bacterium]|nr:hypothetical protein [Brevinematales bacterium]